MESEKLLPCPFCGNDGDGPIEHALHISHTENDWRDPQESHSVQCDKCTATMGYSDTEAEAIAAWNTRAPADLRSALEAETIERAARAMCVHDGLDPDEHIIGGQASGFEDYGPLWQAEQRSEGQLGITDYAGLARAALAPTKGDVS